MSAALHLAKPADLPRLSPLLEAFRIEENLDVQSAIRDTAAAQLLAGSPHGAIYLMGPTVGPIGYLALSFGWSLEFGGLDGVIDEIYLRPTIRGRGIATEVLLSLGRTLASAGVKALHLEVAPDNVKAKSLYTRCGFAPRDGYQFMSRVF